MYEEAIIHEIFRNRDYSNLARPVENELESLEVSFGSALQQIIDVVSGRTMLDLRVLKV